MGTETTVKRWCVHFSDGTRLVVEAEDYWEDKIKTLRLELRGGREGEEVQTVLCVAPGEWRYLHAVGEDGCEVDRPKYEMKRVLEGAQKSAQKP